MLPALGMDATYRLYLQFAPVSVGASTGAARLPNESDENKLGT
jgi:hypothetical protein